MAPGPGAPAHTHLLMTMARMIGNQPNFRISKMGGLCLAIRTHNGIRAMKPTHTSGIRYRLSTREGHIQLRWPGMVGARTGENGGRVGVEETGFPCQMWAKMPLFSAV